MSDGQKRKEKGLPMRQTVHEDKALCTGCGACATICPKGAIAMRADEEGFLYPAVDGELCVSCDLCEKRCPAGKALPERKQQAFGAQLADEAVRRMSSSGGAFTALARGMLARGGVVFGAAFDEALRVEHVGAFSEEEVVPMRGSKYVQSDATEAIGHAIALLERGVPVLFSGAPCQVNGLLAIAGERYGDLLLTVDFVCHGAPSPGVFASYLRELEQQRGCRVTAYGFRDKRRGWKDFSAVATFEDGSEHVGSQRDEPFLYGFLQNLYLRPACATCEALRGKRRAADITLADLWGAQEACPERDDDTGLSLVLVNSPRGQRAVKACRDLTLFPVDPKPLLRHNPSLERPAIAHRNRDRFFKEYAKDGFKSERVMALLAPPGRVERLAARVAHLPKGLARRVKERLGR